MTSQDDYDWIQNPEHYGGSSLYEHVRVVAAWDLSYELGCATKYICRAGKKPGSSRVQDLEKAIRYIQLEIRRIHETGVGEQQEIAIPEPPAPATAVVPSHMATSVAPDPNWLPYSENLVSPLSQGLSQGMSQGRSVPVAELHPILRGPGPVHTLGSRTDEWDTPSDTEVQF